MGLFLILTANNLPVAVGGGNSANISWSAPTTNSAGQSFDGSTNDRTISEYRVYYDTISPPAAYLVTTTSTSIDITGLTSGTWYFAVTAVDGDGDESDISGIITKVVT